MEEQFQTVTRLIDLAVEFGVAYGLQLLGALVILLIGLKVAKWTGLRVVRLCELRNLDITLSRFFGNMTKFLIVVIVVIITLSNFGIDIAPPVALAGASAFGLSFALAEPDGPNRGQTARPTPATPLPGASCEPSRCIRPTAVPGASPPPSSTAPPVRRI